MFQRWGSLNARGRSLAAVLKRSICVDLYIYLLSVYSACFSLLGVRRCGVMLPRIRRVKRMRSVWLRLRRLLLVFVLLLPLLLLLFPVLLLLLIISVLVLVCLRLCLRVLSMVVKKRRSYKCFGIKLYSGI